MAAEYALFHSAYFIIKFANQYDVKGNCWTRSTLSGYNMGIRHIGGSHELIWFYIGFIEDE